MKKYECPVCGAEMYDGNKYCSLACYKKHNYIPEIINNLHLGGDV